VWIRAHSKRLILPTTHYTLEEELQTQQVKLLKKNLKRMVDMHGRRWEVYIKVWVSLTW